MADPHLDITALEAVDEMYLQISEEWLFGQS